jgi:hypothetical protein
MKPRKSSPGKRAPRPAKASNSKAPARTRTEPAPGKHYDEDVLDIVAGTGLHAIAAQLIELETKAEDEAWMLQAEDAAEDAHHCRDIIGEFVLRQHSQEHRDILRQAAQQVAEAFLDTGTTEDLSEQSDRHPNSRPFLYDRYRDALFAFLRTHAALRLAGTDSQRFASPVPFNLANLSVDEADAPEVISEVSKWKDAAAIVLLLAGEKELEILLARFGLRWKDKDHLTDYVQAAVLARAKVGTPLTNTDQCTVTALQKLNILPDDPDSAPIKALETRRQRMKRKISDATDST